MFGLLSLVFSGLGALASYEAGQEQAAEQRRQNEVRNRLNALKERRAKIQAFRERRNAEAEVTSTGVRSGSNFTASSGFQGGLASIGSQFANNQGFVTQVNELQSQLGTDSTRTNRLAGASQLFGAAGGLFGDTFGGYSEINDSMKTLFK